MSSFYDFNVDSLPNHTLTHSNTNTSSNTQYTHTHTSISSPRPFSPPVVYTPMTSPVTTSRPYSQSYPLPYQYPERPHSLSQPMPIPIQIPQTTTSTPLCISPTSAFTRTVVVSSSHIHPTTDNTEDIPMSVSVDSMDNGSVMTDCNGHDWSFVKEERKRNSIIRWKEKKMRRDSGLSKPKVYRRRQVISKTRHRIGGKFVSEEEWIAYKEHDKETEMV